MGDEILGGLGGEAPAVTRLRVVVAEDDVLYREGVAGLLERSGFSVVGQARDAAELLSVVRAQRPDLAVVDIRMPPTHTTEGLDAARVIREELPDIGILVLSVHVDPEFALRAGGRRAGVGLPAQEPGRRCGRIHRHAQTDRQRNLGRGPRRGEGIARRAPARRPARSDDQPRTRSARLDCGGTVGNAGIARRLWITGSTVEKHVHSVLTKLGLSDTDDDHRRVLAAITFLARR